MGRLQRPSKKAGKKKRAGNNSDASGQRSESWVGSLLFQRVDDGDAGMETRRSSDYSSPTLSILSWNVLAEAYCSRFSQVHLPAQYQKVVFSKTRRKELILQVLEKLCDQNNIDVACLQEVDLTEIGDMLRTLGYVGVETPRVAGGGAGGRTDACAVYVRSNTPLLHDAHGESSLPRWQFIDHVLLRLDDLATLSTADSGDDDNDDDAKKSQQESAASNASNCSNIQGMQMSLLRRNMAVLVRLRDTLTNQTIVLANAHLYWNPGFEYVKLCQAHYILKRAQSFQKGPNEPVVLCGDLNSRPGGVTHTYLSTGHINAKRIAPWYAWGLDDEEMTVEGQAEEERDATAVGEQNGTTAGDESYLVSGVKRLNVFDGDRKEEPRMRYLLDASLNKLCRWLRILGQDVALETDEEEKLRTGKGEMIIFERCVKERRTLVTTSPRLMQRRDCPPSVYCIHPPFLSKLEVALVHMLLTHGVILEPSTFLSRCVVCNGSIVEEHDDAEKRRILSEYEAPPDLIDDGMAVYECDGCRQGYWWNDRPTSSASRVKTAAIRLFELCVRGGVPFREDDDADGMFRDVNVRELEMQGWDSEIPGSELLRQRLDVVDWLKQEDLECPFALESVYAHTVPGKGDEAVVVGESLPFTNVTHQFVDTLDYIFFDRERLDAIERFYVPTSFRELGDGRTYIENAHLLPSDVWPSDHLAIGARLSFLVPDDTTTVANGHAALTLATETLKAAETKDEPTNENAGVFIENGGPEFADLSLQFCAPIGRAQASNLTPNLHHGKRCACGCVPAIPSLFEMAELRKQAKLKAAQSGDL